MNGIFLAIVLIGFLVTGYRQLGWVPDIGPGPMEALTAAMLDAAKSSVSLR